MKLNKKNELVLSEKDVRKQIKGYLQAQGFYVKPLKNLHPLMVERIMKGNYPLAFLWYNHQGLGSYRGLPDMAGYFQGHYFWIETKKPKGKLSPTQEIFITIARAHGAKVFVAYSFEGFKMEWDSWVVKIKAGQI